MRNKTFLLIIKIFVINLLLFSYSNSLFAQEIYSKKIQKAINSLIKVKSKPTEKRKQKVATQFEKIIQMNTSEKGFAYLYLADLYSFHSPEVLQDLPLSLEYYTKADFLLDDSTPFEKSGALYNRGLFHYRGTSITQNFDSAAFFFEKAAIVSPARSSGIGEMYEFGIGVPQELSLAMLHYQNCCLHGSDAYAKIYGVAYLIDQIDANSLDTIGYLKFKEAILLHSIEGSVKAGFLPLVEAAERGYVPAQYELGTSYMYGFYSLDVNENKEKSQYWLKKAAEKKFIPAMHNLAVLYEILGATIYGNSNRTIAFPLYKEAAEKGYPPSQVAMGVYYQYGLDMVSINYNTAFNWYSAAASEGYKLGEIKIKALNTIIREQALEESLRIFQANINNLSQTILTASQIFNTNKQIVTVPTGQNSSYKNSPQSFSNNKFCNQYQDKYNDLIKKVKNGVEICLKMDEEHQTRLKYEPSYYNFGYGSDFVKTEETYVKQNQKMMKTYRNICPEISISEWETISVYKLLKK